jgi:hypothetical protein
MTVSSAEFTTPASVNVTDSLAFENFDPLLFTSLLYRELAWDFASEYKPAVLELNVYMVSEKILQDIPMFIHIEVDEMEEPIFYTIPRD